MSAQFVLKYREQFVRVLRLRGTERDTMECVARERASIFTSEAEAWHAAYRFDLRPDWCAVAAVAEVGSQRAEVGGPK